MQKLWEEDREKYLSLMATTVAPDKGATRRGRSVDAITDMLDPPRAIEDRGSVTAQPMHARLESWEDPLALMDTVVHSGPGINPAVPLRQETNRGRLALVRPTRRAKSEGPPKARPKDMAMAIAAGEVIRGIGLGAGACAWQMGQSVVPSSDTIRTVAGGAVTIAQCGAQAVPEVCRAAGATARTGTMLTKNMIQGATAVVKQTILAAQNIHQGRVESAAKKRRRAHTRITYETAPVDKAAGASPDRVGDECTGKCMICRAAALRRDSPCCAVIHVHEPTDDHAKEEGFKARAKSENSSHVCLCAYCANVINEDRDTTRSREGLIPVANKSTAKA